MDRDTMTSHPTSPKSPRLMDEAADDVVQEVTGELNDIVIVESPVRDTDENTHDSQERGHEAERVEQQDDERSLAVAELCCQLIQQAPPGQVAQVLNYCRDMAENTSLSFRDVTERAARQQEIRDGLVVSITEADPGTDPDADHRTLLVTSDNFDETTSIGSDGQRRFHINLLDRTASAIPSNGQSGEEQTVASKDTTTGSSSPSSPVSLEDCPFETEMRKKLQSYCSALFPKTGHWLLIRQTASQWIIHVVGERLNLKSYWSGHWHSVWKVNLQEGEGVEVSGEFSLRVHHYEDGNVQLCAQKSIPVGRLKAATPTEQAEKIHWKIRDCEDAIQLALNDSYQQLSETTFKRLRRQLPVTRAKMDWSKFANYRLGTELQGSGK